VKKRTTLDKKPTTKRKKEKKNNSLATIKKTLGIKSLIFPVSLSAQ